VILKQAKAEQPGQAKGLASHPPTLPPSEADFATTIAVNLAGFFHISQKAASRMLRAGSGHIINITATIAEQPMATLAAAVASLVKGSTPLLARSPLNMPAGASA
jgi:NAD(P)-dependent dehydrogenase (short-subunit alcohol dehydrogenase family)